MMHQTDKVGADKIIREAVTFTKMLFLGNTRMDPRSGETPTYYFGRFSPKTHEKPDMRTLK